MKKHIDRHTIRQSMKFATIVLVGLFVNISAHAVFATTFTIPFTTDTNYTHDTEVEVTGGLAKLKETSLWNGLQAYWKMDDASGQISDYSGNGNNLANHGASYGSSGLLGDSMSFVEDGYLDGGGTMLNMGLDDMTISAWFKTTDNNGAIVSKSFYSGQDERYTTLISGGYIKTLMDYGPNKIVSTPSAPYLDNQWHHVVTVFDRDGYMKIYLDGVEKDSIDISGSATVDFDKNNHFFIGRYNDPGGGSPHPSALKFSGNIDETAVWNRVLTPTEITELYNVGNGRSISKYGNGTFEIYKTAGDTDTISTFTGFTVDTGNVQGSLSYQLSDDGVNWKYWDGAVWTNAGVGQSNTANEVDSNISSFPTTADKIYVKALLTSDGSQKVEIDRIRVDYATGPITAPDLQSGSDTGASNTDNITSNTSPVFDVQCRVSGLALKLYVDGVVNGTHNCSSAGTEAILVSNSLADGTHSITYTETENGTESSASPALTIRIDTQDPVLTATIDTQNPYSVDNPHIVFSATDTVSVDHYELTYIQDNSGVGVSGTTTAIIPATSPVTLSLDPDEALHTVSIIAYDTAGNGSVKTLEFPPTVNFSSPYIFNASPFDSQVVITSPLGNDIDTITVNDIGGTGASLGTCTGAGNDATSPFASPVTCTITGIASSGEIEVSARDSGLNVIGKNSQTYTIDTQDPAISITAPTKSSGSQITDTTIRVTDNNGITVANVNVDATSTVSTSAFSCTQTTGTQVDCTITIDGPTDSSPHTLVITATDDAGNNVTQTENGYIIDTTPPTSPVVAPDLISSSDTGLLNNDNITSDTTPTFDVQCTEANSTITLYIDGNPDTTVNCGGAGVVGITSSSLADGNYNVVYTETDNVGNESTDSPTFTVTIDTVAPTVPAITTPTDNATTDDDTPTFTGAGEPGSVVSVKDANGDTVCTVAVDPAGNWTCASTVSLSEGAHTFYAEAVDIAGNGPAVGADMTLTTDYNDTDGVDDVIEDEAPAGDGNGDGVSDKRQSNVATQHNSQTSQYTTLVAGNNCSVINDYQILREGDLPVQDTGYIYPVGLNDFQLRCDYAGGGASIVFYYDKEYDTGDWVYRRYDTTTQKFVDMTAQVFFGTAVVHGKTVTTVSYTVVDGYPEDEDGAINGLIRDPSGPAVRDPSGSLAEAGTDIRLPMITALAVLAVLSSISVDIRKLSGTDDV